MTALDVCQVLVASFVRQCSVNFRCPRRRIQDGLKRTCEVFTDEGVTYITYGDEEREKKEQFESQVTVPGDTNDNEQLTMLTDELKTFTEEVGDIVTDGFSLTWGMNPDALPCLLGCGGTYTCSPGMEPYAPSALEIALFLAIETAATPDSGTCFSNRGGCGSIFRNVDREKIELHRIRRMNSVLQYDAPEFTSYIRRRIVALCPSALMSSVPVCARCYGLYWRQKAPASRAVTRPPSRAGTPKKSSRPATAVVTPRKGSTSTLVTSRTAAPSVRGSGDVSSVRQSPTSSRPLGREHTPSGLTYVQRVSPRTAKGARKAYKAAPFPAFLQHK